LLPDVTPSSLLPLLASFCHSPQGSLVRAIRRLEELLRQVAAALKVVGEVALAEKFESAIGRIKRDIVFAASLYL
jgi:ATP-dependent RNA helicase DOB1